MSNLNNKFHHIFVLLFFFISFSNAIPCNNIVPISLAKHHASLQQPEHPSTDFEISDIDAFMHQFSDPMPTSLPQQQGSIDIGDDMNSLIGSAEESLEESSETPVMSDDFESDEQFFQDNIGRDPEDFLVTVEPKIDPTESVDASFTRKLPSFCTRKQTDCLFRQRCGLFVFRPSTNRRLNRDGRRLRQICRRKCRIKAQIC